MLELDRRSCNKRGNIFVFHLWMKNDHKVTTNTNHGLTCKALRILKIFTGLKWTARFDPVEFPGTYCWASCSGYAKNWTQVSVLEISSLTKLSKKYKSNWINLITREFHREIFYLHHHNMCRIYIQGEEYLVAVPLGLGMAATEAVVTRSHQYIRQISLQYIIPFRKYNYSTWKPILCSTCLRKIKLRRYSCTRPYITKWWRVVFKKKRKMNRLKCIG